MGELLSPFLSKRQKSLQTQTSEFPQIGLNQNFLDFGELPETPFRGISLKQDNNDLLHLCREGAPWKEDMGFRLFIVPTEGCKRAAELFKEQPVAYYEWFKANDAFGRRLALGEGEVIMSSDIPFTIILKRVEHRTRNRVTTPDVYRWEVSKPQEIKERMVDRLVHWDGIQPLRLSLLAADAPVVFFEDKRLLHQNWEDNNNMKDTLNNGLAIIPGENAVILDELRSHQGMMGPSVAAVKVGMEKAANGQKIWVVKRSDTDLYFKLKDSTDEKWKANVLETLGLNNINELEDVASGINGIMDENGQLHCFAGSKEIRVPAGGKVLFMTDAKRSQRRIMNLEVYEDSLGQELVHWIDGIEPLEMYEVLSDDQMTKSTVYLTPVQGQTLMRVQAEKAAERENEIRQREVAKTSEKRPVLPENQRFYG